MHFAVYNLNTQPFPVDSLPCSCKHVFAGQHVCCSTCCIISSSLNIASEQRGLLIQVDVEASGVAVGVTEVVVGVDVVVVTSSLR